MNKYLIQYSIGDWNDDLDHMYYENFVVVKDFTDKELEDFCLNKDKLNVTFIKSL